MPRVPASPGYPRVGLGVGDYLEVPEGVPEGVPRVWEGARASSGTRGGYQSISLDKRGAQRHPRMVRAAWGTVQAGAAHPRRPASETPWARKTARGRNRRPRAKHHNTHNTHDTYTHAEKSIAVLEPC